MYKVDYNNRYGVRSETKYMGIGTHRATIKKILFQQDERQERLRNGNLVNVGYEHMNVILENAQGEVQFDKIWHNLNEEQTHLVYNEAKLNMYSYAVKLNNGDKFETMVEWAKLLEGRQVKVIVVENVYEKDGETISKTKVSYVDQVDDEEIEVERGRVF